LRRIALLGQSAGSIEGLLRQHLAHVPTPPSALRRLPPWFRRVHWQAAPWQPPSPPSFARASRPSRDYRSWRVRRLPGRSGRARQVFPRPVHRPEPLCPAGLHRPRPVPAAVPDARDRTRIAGDDSRNDTDDNGGSACHCILLPFNCGRLARTFDLRTGLACPSLRSFGQSGAQWIVSRGSMDCKNLPQLGCGVQFFGRRWAGPHCRAEVPSRGFGSLKYRRPRALHLAQPRHPLSGMNGLQRAQSKTTPSSFIQSDLP
jgi:hypothetical protein